MPMSETTVDGDFEEEGPVTRLLGSRVGFGIVVADYALAAYQLEDGRYSINWAISPESVHREERLFVHVGTAARFFLEKRLHLWLGSDSGTEEFELQRSILMVADHRELSVQIGSIGGGRELVLAPRSTSAPLATMEFAASDVERQIRIPRNVVEALIVLLEASLDEGEEADGK